MQEFDHSSGAGDARRGGGWPYDLEIANVRFRVTGPDDLEFDDRDIAYREFMSDVRHEVVADVGVVVRMGDLPNLEGLECIFNTGQSWALFSDGEDRYIALYPSESDQPYCIAQIDADGANVVIYCGERMIQRSGDKERLSNPLHYPLDQILLMHVLSSRSGLIIHSTGVVLDGAGIVCAGRSGAGKSTLARLVRGDGEVKFLSDDRLVVRKTGDGFRVFGTPWPGEAGVAGNSDASLAAICFLHHGDENRSARIKASGVAERLLPVSSIPWYDEGLMGPVMKLCGDVAARVPAYDLFFRPDQEFADELPRILRRMAAVM